MGELGRTAKFYKDNPEARKRRLAQQKKLDKTAKYRKKRAKLVKINRDKGTYGNGDGLDYDHAKKRMVKASVNRGRNSKNGGTQGDIKARG